MIFGGILVRRVHKTIHLNSPPCQTRARAACDQRHASARSLDSSGTRGKTRQGCEDRRTKNVSCRPLATMGEPETLSRSRVRRRDERATLDRVRMCENRDPILKNEHASMGRGEQREGGSTDASRISATSRWALNCKMTSGEATRSG